MKPSFILRGKALYRKADKLLELMKDTLSTPDFKDKQRIKELVLQIHTSLQNRFNRNAMKYAVQLALSGFSGPSHLSHVMHGLPYYKAVQKFAKEVEKSPQKLIDSFLLLKERIFAREGPHLVLSCDETMHKKLVDEQFFGLCSLPKIPAPAWQRVFNPTPLTSQARVISSPVAFTVQAFPPIHDIHPRAPGLTCIMPLFENKILHRKIREEGGAYGSGASFSATFGNFYFHSYRDPNLSQTLSTFRLAIDELAQGKFDEHDLREAKLGVIQSMDLPVAPGSRAHVAYNLLRDGRTTAMRQQFRDTLLSLTKKQILTIIEEHIVSKKDAGITVSFAGKELLEKEKALPIAAL